MNRNLLICMCLAAIMPGSTMCVTAKAANVASVSVSRVDGSKKVKRQVKVKPFSKIEMRGSVDVVFRQASGKPVVAVEGSSAWQESVDVYSDGKTLVLTQKTTTGWHTSGDEGVKVYVSAPDLTSVTLNGSGDFDIDGTLTTGRLEVNVRGSGDVDMKNVVCSDASVKVYGSGDVDITKLVARRTADIGVYGSGDVEVGFAKSGFVTCGVYGSGDVELKGSVRELKKQVKGSGEIKTGKLKKWR